MGYFKSIKERDPAAKNWLYILLFYPGVKAIINYRIARFFYKIKLNIGDNTFKNIAYNIFKICWLNADFGIKYM